MKKQHLKTAQKFSAAMLSILICLAQCFVAVAVSDNSVEEIRNKAVDTTYRGWICVDENNAVAVCKASDIVTLIGTPASEDDMLILKPGDGVVFSCSVSQAGRYGVLLDYRLKDESQSASGIAQVTVGESSVFTTVYGIWQDETKEYAHDRYGNEVTPNQCLAKEFTVDYVCDSKSLDMSPIKFDFTEGINQISLLNCDQDIILRSVKVVRITEDGNYTDYCAALPKASDVSDFITVEGEDYAIKSDSYIRVQSKNNPAVYPYNPYQKMLSTIDCGSYDTIGQRVVWNFSVKKSGWYQMALHYSQPDKEGQSTYRDIEIDGKVLFDELHEVAFGYTGNAFKNLVVTADDKPVKVYLTAGTHTFGLFTQAPTMESYVRAISQIISELSDIGLSLQQVAGNNADSHRSWDIETYMPGVVEKLEKTENQLLDLYKKMGELSGTTPASCINLKLAAGIIKQALKKPEKLPSKISELSIGSGSATELLAGFQNQLRQQGIALDRFYLYTPDNKLPDESAGFITSASAGIKRFFYSLFNKNNGYAAGSAKKDVLNVWVNRSVTHVETLQMLADSYFTPESGIKVQLSVMPNANKLLLSNASNTCPDVALGVPNATPYQLGLRDAAADFSSFTDLEKTIKDNFYISDLEPYVYDGKVYGLPETMQFNVLMYRSDILNKLGLSVPETWGDVADMMPVLRRNGMTFYLPISSNTGVKSLSGILPFFFQSGASLYSKDGMSVAFNSTTGIKAFETLTDLYSLYSLQNNMPSFYNHFRYGTAPVGVGEFSNYMQVLYAAPEIADCWKIALAPGMEDENGTVHRQFSSADRGVLIMNSSNKKEQAWEFLKWWLSSDVQTEFSHTLLVKFGSEFIWNSANKNAFANLSLPSSDRKIIQEQWQQAENYRNLPVTYMFERELSDAWYEVVNQGKPARIALNQAAVAVNTELALKMKEFRYLDEQGNVIRTHNMQSVDEILKGGKEQ